MGQFVYFLCSLEVAGDTTWESLMYVCCVLEEEEEEEEEK